jgi:hypothetical protein
VQVQPLATATSHAKDKDKDKTKTKTEFVRVLHALRCSFYWLSLRKKGPSSHRIELLIVV